MSAAPPADNRAEVERRAAESWERAQENWSRFLLLRPPVDNKKQGTVAQIHLGTREISLNYTMIAEKRLFDCVEAMLAHEIGHHVRYPATLAVEARLRLLEKSLIPLPNY